ncbi:MAG TPA: hypothetical protein VFL91_24000 [Thermomicrobiales bacterium]|nr:hypothetical protein [Thermomicrobiales bacterium]
MVDEPSPTIEAEARVALDAAIRVHRAAADATWRSPAAQAADFATRRTTMTGHRDDLPDDEAAIQGEIAALCARHRARLAEAGTTLLHHYLSDLRFLELSWGTAHYDFAETMMSHALPDGVVPFDARLFARQFAICLAVVAGKLAQPTPPPLACVAEELACQEILEEAASRLDDPALRDDFVALHELLISVLVPTTPDVAGVPADDEDAADDLDLAGDDDGDVGEDLDEEGWDADDADDAEGDEEDDADAGELGGELPIEAVPFERWFVPYEPHRPGALHPFYTAGPPEMW